mmetsp:Transcript_10880/g.33365  ORF Transcript_10880/g.33365 Transcript_10880/m.33365 type:complete len:408 (+) Transcript_10880:34-1257(+)
MADRKDPNLNQQHSEILRQLLLRPENKHCADCGSQAPRWASTNLGVFICIRCSGIHRNLGVHISTVRSTTLDTWTPKQIEEIQRKGNNYGKQKYEACVPENIRRPDPNDTANVERWIRDKYEKKLFMRKEDGGRGGEVTARDRRRPLQTSRPVSSSGENSDVRKMVDMGFDSAESAAALMQCRGDVSGAIELLLSNPRHKTHGPNRRSDRESHAHAQTQHQPHSDQRGSQVKHHPKQPSAQKAAEVNLIDFGFEGDKPSIGLAPAQAPSNTQTTDDDFADFSAFESAPSLTAPEAPVNQAPAASDNLMDTITSLYKTAPANSSSTTGHVQQSKSSNAGVLAQNGAAQDDWWSSGGGEANATSNARVAVSQPPTTAPAAPKKDVFDDLFGGSGGGFDSLLNNLNTKKN